MVSAVLEVVGLAKRFGRITAVDGISFTVPRGRVVGLLGPNGAGKTTTIHLLLGITRPSGGEIRYFGQDFATHRRACLQRINFASAFNHLQGRISSWENLLVFSALYGIRRPERKILELADRFGVRELLHRRFWDLSAGNQTRMMLVKSLLNDPELILMDEPTASLDPDIADQMLTLIEELRRTRQLSLLYTSHDMDEVTRLCDTVIFLDHGTIVAEDSPLGLTKRITTARLKVTFDGDPTKVTGYLRAQSQAFTLASSSVVTIPAAEARIPALIFGLSQTGVQITDLDIRKPTLEDVFLQIARKTSYVAPH